MSKFATTLQVGDPLDPATVVGPVISGVHCKRVQSYIDLGRQDAWAPWSGAQHWL